jgi:hypothetical protein
MSFNKVKCELYAYTKQDDDLGIGQKRTFQKKDDLYGYFDYINGSDKFIQDKFRSDVTHIFISFNKILNIALSDYIKFNGNFYQIILIDNPMQTVQSEILLKFIGGSIK